MEFIEAFICGCIGNWVYKKGQEEGQKQVIDQVNFMNQQREIDALKREINELKRLGPS